MIEIINNINNIFGNSYFLIVAETISFIFKLSMGLFLIFYSWNKPKINKLISLLIVIIFSSMFINFTWIFNTARNLFFNSIDPRICFLLIRLSWVTAIIQFQVLGLFLENLTEKKIYLKHINKIFIAVNSIICLYFLYQAIFDFNIYTNSSRSPLEKLMMHVSI